MRKLFKILKIGLIACLIVIIILLFLSTYPYRNQPKVSVTSKKDLLTVDQFYGDKDSVDQVALIEGAHDAFNIRHLLIAEAKGSIKMSYYRIHDDASSQALLGDLLLAADRGVKIDLTIDGKVPYSSPSTYKKLIDLNQHENITVRLYNPPHLNNFLQWQSMLHDKYLIVDDQYALVGGNNIGDRYFAPQSFKGRITEDRDVLIYNAGALKDSVLLELISYANEFNQLSINEEIVEAGNLEDVSFLKEHASSYHLVEPELYKHHLSDYLDQMHITNRIKLITNPTHNRIKEPLIAYQLKEIMKKSNKVIIQTPYATGNNQLIEAIKTENEKNLRMITNSISSSPNIFAFSNYIKNRNKFIDAGLDIYEFQSNERSIHAKSLTFDDRLSVVGTFNLDDRSMYVSTEMMMVIDSTSFNQELNQAFKTIEQESFHINSQTGADELDVSLLKKIIIEIISVFSRLFQHII